MPHDDDEQFLRETSIGINFEEEAEKFFDPEASEDFLHRNQQPVGASIYADDPVRVYLSECVVHTISVGLQISFASAPQNSQTFLQAWASLRGA